MYQGGYPANVNFCYHSLNVEDSYYLVKWKNHPSEQNSWIHYTNFNTFDLINSYWNNKE
jgi:hypothetical protein